MSEKDYNYLIGEPNAVVWAAAFWAVHGDTPEAIDEELMQTWFANAIQTGEDVGRAKTEGNAIQRVGLFSSILATMTGAWDGKQEDWMLQPPDFLSLWEALDVLLVDSEGPVYRDQANAALRILNLLDPKRANAPLVRWWADLDRKATEWEATISHAEVTKV